MFGPLGVHAQASHSLLWHLKEKEKRERELLKDILTYSGYHGLLHHEKYILHMWRCHRYSQTRRWGTPEQSCKNPIIIKIIKMGCYIEEMKGKHKRETKAKRNNPVFIFVPGRKMLGGRRAAVCGGRLAAGGGLMPTRMPSTCHFALARRPPTTSVAALLPHWTGTLLFLFLLLFKLTSVFCRPLCRLQLQGLLVASGADMA
jgi:hypothetical protein